jgi:hypothetical protein
VLELEVGVGVSINTHHKVHRIKLGVIRKKKTKSKRDEVRLRRLVFTRRYSC